MQGASAPCHAPVALSRDTSLSIAPRRTILLEVVTATTPVPGRPLPLPSSVWAASRAGRGRRDCGAGPVVARPSVPRLGHASPEGDARQTAPAAPRGKPPRTVSPQMRSTDPHGSGGRQKRPVVRARSLLVLAGLGSSRWYSANFVWYMGSALGNGGCRRVWWRVRAGWHARWRRPWRRGPAGDAFVRRRSWTRAITTSSWSWSGRRRSRGRSAARGTRPVPGLRSAHARVVLPFLRQTPLAAKVGSPVCHRGRGGVPNWG